ncbi:MAG TPA: HD domain-containing protein [Bryobacteraceae bacterium]
MKSAYVRELRPNEVITTTFLVHLKDVRQKKSGEPYLSLLLGDRTGELDAKMWDNVADVMDTFDRDDFVKVKGLLQIFQNRPQLTIHKMCRVIDSDVDFGDYFPVSERDPMEMFLELRGIVSGIGNQHLRALLNAFLDDEPLARMYRTAPAAKHVHHAWLGGLIEHVLSMCHLCRVTAAHYRYVDLDLLLAGAILHDIGKVAELTYDRTFGYSSEGQLLGHIVIGLRLVNEKLQRFPEFPPKLRVLLEHLIVSHHGQLEFGSPKVPLFAEALLLHHLDNLDSKMECMRKMVAGDRHVEGCWTAYSSALDRTVLKTSKYLEEEPAQEREAFETAASEPGASVGGEPSTAANGQTPEPAPAVAAPAETAASAFPGPPTRADRSPGGDAFHGAPKPSGPKSVFAEKLREAWRKDS